MMLRLSQDNSLKYFPMNLIQGPGMCTVYKIKVRARNPKRKYKKKVFSVHI